MRVIITMLFVIAAQAAVTGEWTGSGLRLILEVDEGTAIEGELIFNGQSFAVQGQAQGDRFQGTFGTEAASFPISLQVSGNSAVLDSQGNRYQLTRTVAANPLAAVGATAAPNPLAGQAGSAAQPTAGGQCTQTFRHPLGISFRHPPGWQPQDTGDAVLLTPPDLAQVNGMQAEITLLFGDAKETVGPLGGSQMQQICNMIVVQMLPGLQPSGQGQQQAGGIRYDYAGTHVQLQRNVKASIWVKIVGPYAVGVMAAAEPAVYERRMPIWNEIFTSFGYEKPPADNRLAGNWMYENIYSSGDFSMVTVHYLRLTADGRCAFSSDAAASSNSGSIINEGDGWEKTGTWSSADKRIDLQWNDGSSESWELIFDGSSMLWKSGGSKKLWQRR